MAENYNMKKNEKTPEEKNAPKAKLKEKTFRQKVRDAFISEEVHDIKSYIVFDVIIPAVKTTFRNLIVNSLDLSLFGKVGGGKRDGSRNDTYIAYERAYGGKGGGERMYSPRPQTRDNGSIDVREIDRVWFETEQEANDVIYVCREIYDANAGVLSVAEFLDAAQMKTSPIHHKWGWIDISHASAEPYPDGSGWYVNLPRPRPL